MRGLWEDAPNVARHMTAYKRLREQGVVVVLTWLSSGTEAIIPWVARDEVPCIYISGGHSSPMVTKPLNWVIIGTAGLGSEVVAFANWVKANWTDPRPPRIGFFICDTSQGWETLEGVPYITELGIEVVGYEVAPLLGVIDTSVEWLRLVAKNPDWVFVAHYAQTLVTVVKDARRLEIQEKGIKLMAEAISLDEAVLRVVGEDGDGWYRICTDPSATQTDLPGMKGVLETAKENRHWAAEDVPMPYVRFWVASQVGVKATQLAIEKVGIEHLSGRSVREGLTSINTSDNNH